MNAKINAKMNAKHSAALLMIFALGFVPASLANQDPVNQQQPGEQDKDKPTPEKKAVLLLDQVLGDAGALKLPENRIYVQISAGDLLWDRDESRARVLFGEAGSGIAEMIRRSESPNDQNSRRAANANRLAMELRQELVLTVARHSGEFAYQLLQTMPSAPPATGPGVRRQDSQNSLEQSLVAAIAANDPKTAAKNAQGWLDKGEYPASFSKVLSQLQSKDAEAATKLSDQLVKKMQPEELLLKSDAVRLSLSLLRPGPRAQQKPGDQGQPAQPAQSVAGSPDQLLAEQAFRDVMSAAITAALRATPQAQNAQARGGPGAFRGRPNNQVPLAAPQSEADIQQANARMLLSGLQSLQPQIDKYLPERSLAVKQKLTQMGMENDPRAGFSQMANLMQQGTSDSLIAAAATAPQQMQNRMYQQAALKAIDEGNPDRARDIANQHLEGTARTNTLHTLELRQAVSSTTNKADDIRQTINRAQSDEERLSLLLQFAGNLQAENPKLALQLLDEARGLVSRRATSYAQFEAQVNVAHAFASLDPAKSFETMEPGINQMNELLSAAALLSGFELNIFKDGELPLQGGGSLAGMVARYGTELAGLARIDFEKAQMLTDRFVLAEPRILAKLTVVRGVLGVAPIEPANNGRGGGGQFGRRQQ
ncbi:MAG TPA: hypothetical protein VN937_26650 [Blastocatellia bacterium]|nr:hypothetical protein [Blastocatellia bacterium]